ncbi:hypothetical protein ABIF69_007385 [Bradyrhizobium japonicum]
MIDRDHDLSIVRQAKVLKLARSTVYYDPAGHFKFLRVWSVKFLHPRGRTRDC